ncbi:MAG TPA: serine hydrolase domain-containing protein [Candidatus Binatia bacterium]|nr:serine hydrolase domain-containing protein [Candidatus Binatia bacterium]
MLGKILAASVALAFGSVAPAAMAQTPPACNTTPNAAFEPLQALATATIDGNYAAIRETIQQRWAPIAPGAADAALALSDLAALGPLRQLRLCNVRENVAVTILASELTGAANQVAVRLDESAQIDVAQINLSVRPLDPHPSFTRDADRLNYLRAYIDRLTAGDAFSGVVLIGRNDEILFQRAFGADITTGAPLTIASRFNLASLNKIMTATAILRLVQDNRLSLDDYVAEILPAASSAPGFAAVQIKHLLSHTSGFSQDRSVLEFEPGQRFLYSNLGFRILGEVIQARTGMAYIDYLQETVMAPTGMTATGVFDAADRENVVPGYSRRLHPTDAIPETATLQPNPYLQSIPGGAMGGLYSTAEDLFRFGSALIGNRLISADLVALMRAPRPELNAPAYGFGVMLRTDSDVWGHGGSLPGADAAIEFYANGYFAVVIANRDDAGLPVLLVTRALFHRP